MAAPLGLRGGDHRDQRIGKAEIRLRGRQARAGALSPAKRLRPDPGREAGQKEPDAGKRKWFLFEILQSLNCQKTIQAL